MPETETENENSGAEIERMPSKNAPVHTQLASFLAGELVRRGLREVVEVRLHDAPFARGRPTAKGELIRSWEKDEDEELFSPAGARQLASDILAYAAHSFDAPGAHRFVVYARNRNDQGAKKLFTLEEEERAEDFEEPTAAQALSQQMRFSEIAVKMALQTANATNETLMRQLELANDRILKLEDMRLKHFDEREELLSRETERATQLIEAESASKRKDAIVEKLGALVPVVANRIAGKLGAPSGTPSPRDQIIASILGRLKTDAQLAQRLVGVLPPEMTIQLLELIRSSEESEAKS